MKTRAKNNVRHWLMAIALSLSVQGAYADLEIPGISGVVGVEGSDGELAPTASITIDLSLAKTANWDSPGEGNGVYDPDKWAVVYKYSSIDIPAGVWVSFINHPSGAPVVWLVTGNVSIAGGVNLNGQNASTVPKPSEPGPGGYAGGNGIIGGFGIASSGFGPGGAIGNDNDSASHDTLGIGDVPGALYGNARLLPLIGGSGGSGSNRATINGGAGGGAILLVATKDIDLNGIIQAQGGPRHTVQVHGTYVYSGYGSGGAVRLIADSISGTGSIYTNSGGSGNGYIRMETLNYNGNLVFIPTVPVNAPDDPVQLWPPEAAPSIRIVSVGNHDVPSDPTGSPQSGEFDFQLDNESSSDIILEAKNVPSDALVKLRIIPVYGASTTETAVFSSGTDALSSWTVGNVTLPEGGFVLQAHSITPIP